MYLLNQIENFLADRIGLNAGSIGQASINRASKLIIKKHNLDGIDDLVQKSLSDKRLLDELIDEVTVAETWFFRDDEPFEYLKQYLADEWLPVNPKKALRALSVPCSTGEEPYSLAITFSQLGLQPHRFTIDAVDINLSSLEIARRAEYVQNSFRRKSPDENYFVQKEKKFFLKPEYSALVNFHNTNAIESDFFADKPEYNIIFCKNLIIYLTEAARNQLIKNISRLLAPGGIIFTGHTEVIFFHEHGFESIKPLKAFAVRRAEKAKVTIEDKLNPKLRHDCNSHQDRADFRGAFKARVPTSSSDIPLPLKEKYEESHRTIRDITIYEIKKLADSGDFLKAEIECEKYLKRNWNDHSAYCLMGLIKSSMNKLEEAGEFFQKAIYLNPHDYDSLINMSLIFEKKGDRNRAALYFERAKRNIGE